MTHWTCNDCGGTNDEEMLMCKCGSERTEAEGFDRKKQAEKGFGSKVPATAKQLRRTGFIVIAIAAITILQGINGLEESYFSIANVSMGFVILIAGIWAVFSPTPMAMLILGIVIIAAGCWNTFAAIILIELGSNDMIVISGFMTFGLAFVQFLLGIGYIKSRKEIKLAR